MEPEEKVEVVNYSSGDARGLTARVQLVNTDGAVKWERTAQLDSAEDSVASPIGMEYPADLTAVHFVRLQLTRGGRLVSENFYWRGVKEGDFQALRQLPHVKLEASTAVARQGDLWRLTAELRNVSKSPALMVRAKAVREKSGDRLCPRSTVTTTSR